MISSPDLAAPVVPSPTIESTRFLARQPILDRQQRVFAYELLFRSGHCQVFEGESDAATRGIVDGFLVDGIDSLAAGTRVFVNCTREALVDRLVTLLPVRSTVLEILETVEPDDEVLSACRALGKMGYQLALDDFVFSEAMRPLIQLVDFLKIDFRTTDPDERARLRRQIGPCRAAWLAEKVETQAEFKQACAEGFEYFQGFFFCRPIVQSHRNLPPNALSQLRLLAAVSQSPVDMVELEKILQADAPLTYRLLRLVNSAAYGLHREIRSIRSALILVGETEFRKLITVAVSNSMGAGRPSALVSLALVRARFCELLAPQLDQRPAEQYLVGLLSLVDALLEVPMQTIVGRLPLRAEAKAALLGKANSESFGLCLLRNYESGEWKQCLHATAKMHLNPELLNSLYLESVRWTESMLQTR